jgi:hypothetical protein
MLKIDKNIFLSNLRLTQKYCQLQLDNSQKDNATILRSINPILNNDSIFKFDTEHFNFDIEPNINSCVITKWTIDPTESKNDYLINVLFEEQLNIKHRLFSTENNQMFEGDILVSQIDCTVIDGASEVASLGLIDSYDITPIDTWFYLTKTKESRLLFSWIPKTLRHYANDGILVNCVDCFNWFENWYPNDLDKITADN